MIVTDAGLFAKVTDQPVRFSQLARKALRKSIPLFFGLILFFIAYYIGVLLFIVPGIFIYYGWGIFGPVYVNEAGGLFASFGRSWTLMKGYKRWHFLVSFVCGMINSIVILVLFFITFLPFAPFLDFATGEFDTANMMILLFASLLITVSFYLYACLTASMTTAIYLEVKALKEGAGHDNLAEVFA